MNMNSAAKILLLSLLQTPDRVVWRVAEPMPRAEGGAAAGILGEELFLAGGTTWRDGKKIVLREVQLYSIPENRWKQGPQLPQAVAEAAFFTSPTGLDVLGGYDGVSASKKWWHLDTAKSTWTESDKLPEPRLYATADRLGQSILLLGGSPDPDIGHSTDTLFALDRDSTSPGWRKMQPIPGGPRSLHGSAVARKQLFVFGGCNGTPNGDIPNRADAYSYQAATGSWRRLHDLPRALRMVTAVSVDDRFIYLLGGYFATPEQTRREPSTFGFSSAVLVYDIDRDRYTAAADLPAAVAGVPFCLYQRTLYGAGGEDRNYGRSARTLVGRLVPP